MKGNDHIINETILNFKFFGAENHLSIPDQLENWFMHTIVDHISDVFDAFTNKGEHIEIDQLHIDLGQMNYKLFQEGLEAVFKEKLRRKIGALLTAPIKEGGESRVKIHTKEELLEQYFIHFIKLGYLPWEAAHLRIGDLENEILEANRNVQFSLLKALVPLLHQEKIQRRLSFNFSASFILKMKQLISERYGVIPEISPFHLADFNTTTKRKQLWKKLAHSLHFGRSPRIKKDQALTIAEREPLKPNGSAEKAELTLNNAKISVSDAGSVLMHPFLSPLFENLGLTINHTFKDAKQQEKAIGVLFFMARGHMDFTEPQVTLLKLLCGKPIAEPLQFEPKISEKEKEEVQAVLQAAIGHWSALKNTGIETFRNTFLKREGQLLIEDGCMEITVAQETVDILLDQLPWSLSRVNLPWVDRQIRVNWA